MFGGKVEVTGGMEKKVVVIIIRYRVRPLARPSARRADLCTLLLYSTWYIERLDQTKTPIFYAK